MSNDHTGGAPGDGAAEEPRGGAAGATEPPGGAAGEAAPEGAAVPAARGGTPASAGAAPGAGGTRTGVPAAGGPADTGARADDGHTAERTADGRTADGRTADGRTADGRTADSADADAAGHRAGGGPAGPATVPDPDPGSAADPGARADPGPGTGPGGAATGPAADRADRADGAATAPAADGPDEPPTASDGATAPAGASVSRRRLLGGASAAAVGGLAVGIGGDEAVRAATAGDPAPALAEVGTTRVPFHGTHQAGIAQPAQAYGHLAAFDLRAGADRRTVAALLRRWSSAAAEMTRGRPPATGDDQVARDLGPSRLTVTFGFGRSLFTKVEALAGHLPDALAPLPAFSQDHLDPARGDGDLFVQVGADDALVAFHALRTLQRQAHGSAAVRWHMPGFNRAAGSATVHRTPRNLMGQVDGTDNPKPGDAGFARKVFVPESGGPAWMAGGSYAVVRRIRMLLDDWDKLGTARQEDVIGRRKSTGAPLSSPPHAPETDPVRLGATRRDGTPAIPANAHIRVAAPSGNHGAAMLRRTFSYHDGFRSDGAPDAGLLFVAWQADPRHGFVPVQRKMDRGDALALFIRHEASALFAVPGGCAPGEYVGQRLLEP